MEYDYLIVGAGFSGAVFAREAANAGESVLIIDKRDHIGGNSFDFKSKDDLWIQKYGPHIFHTRSTIVWDYLSTYTQWNSYEHQVLVNLGNIEVSFPITIKTLEQLYNREFTAESMKTFLDNKKIIKSDIKNSEDVVLSQVGEDLYDLFFKNYTKKQWGVYPDKLDKTVLNRIPVRFSRDTRYFKDPYQGIPKDGFATLFKNLLNHNNITIRLNTELKNIKNTIKFKKMVYTGAIDSFFEYKFGKLPYRSLDFKFESLNKEYFQSVAVVNYPNYNDYTRITEFKHLYFQKNKKTIICYEYPKSEGDPYYPIPRKENNFLYLKYKKLSESLKDTYFLGRLAEYRYLNMDKVVENSLNLFTEIEGIKNKVI